MKTSELIEITGHSLEGLRRKRCEYDYSLECGW